MTSLIKSADAGYYALGAGGHTRSMLDLVQALGRHIAAIYDDSYKGPGDDVCGVPIRGAFEDCPSEGLGLVSAGAPAIRQKLWMMCGKTCQDNLIHPTAYISEGVALSGAVHVMGRAFVNSCVEIGCNSLINTSAVMEHEVKVGEHCHISVGAILCGRVVVGNGCFIGAGAVIKDKVRICKNVTVGAGSVVLHDITEPGVYVGCPVRRIRA